MQEKRRRGLDDLIPLNQRDAAEGVYNVRKRYTRTIAIKVTQEEYEIYRLVSKYYGPDEITKKWRSDLDDLMEKVGTKLRDLDREVSNALKKA